MAITTLGQLYHAMTGRDLDFDLGGKDVLTKMQREEASPHLSVFRDELNRMARNGGKFPQGVN